MPDEPSAGPPAADGAVNLRDVWTRVIERGRTEVKRAADEGRNRLRMQAILRDLDAFRTRLGKTAYRLYVEGELEHPAIRKAVEHIQELEQELEGLRSSEPHDAP